MTSFSNQSISNLEFLLAVGFLLSLTYRSFVYFLSYNDVDAGVLILGRFSRSKGWVCFIFCIGVFLRLSGGWMPLPGVRENWVSGKNDPLDTAFLCLLFVIQ